MLIHYLTLIFLATIKVCVAVNSQPLNGQQIRVIWPLWNGNAKGLSGPVKGGEIIDYLSSRFNFTFEMVRVTVDRLEPRGKELGLFNYLWDGSCDLLVADVIQASQYLRRMDLTWPYNSDVITFLIPVPDETTNINAVIKPFQWPVWLSLFASMFCVIFVLSQLTCHLKNSSSSKSQPINSYLWVFGNLLSQGGHCAENRPSFRLVAGSWTIAAFIFVQAYTSTLFIYVMAPISSPLVNSVHDILDNKDVNLLIRSGGGVESLFKSSNTTIFNRLQEKVASSPNSRCTLRSECVNLITPGSKNVYADGKPYLMDIIKEVFQKTGKCDLQLARDGFIWVFVSFALSKNSPYTKTINQGLLEIQEIGLYSYWDLWLRPKPYQCLIKRNIVKSSTKLKPALTLKNLFGAFVVLLIGIGFSFVAFIHEKVLFVTKDCILKKNRVA